MKKRECVLRRGFKFDFELSFTGYWFVALRSHSVFDTMSNILANKHNKHQCVVNICVTTNFVASDTNVFTENVVQNGQNLNDAITSSK